VKRLKRLLKYFDNNLERVLCGSLLFVILLILTLQVSTRFLLKFSYGWTEELARYLFIWFVFLGISYGSKEDKHIKVNLIKCFPNKIQIIIRFIGLIILVVFNIIIIINGAKYAQILFVAGQVSLGTKIIMAYIYIAIPISFTLMTYRIIRRIIKRS